MDDITRVIEGLNEISGYDCQRMSLFDNDVFIRGMAQEAAELLKQQQAKIKRLQNEIDRQNKPMKPVYDCPLLRCPRCRNSIDMKQKYCDECGQPIDWLKAGEQE